MADRTLNEWNGLLELIIIDRSPWGLEPIGFCNSAKDWAENADGDEEPTDLLDLPSFTFNDMDYLVLPYKTSGWKHGGDSIARPTIQLADIGGQLWKNICEMGGASLAPVTHMYVLADDVNADNGVIVGNPRHYKINKVTANGMMLSIELGGHSDTTRTKFPPYPMTEQDFPGLRNRYDRA